MSTILDAFAEINKSKCFGYHPNSSSCKPAHIANGWFRRIIERRYDPRVLNQTVVHWVKGVEVNSSDKLITTQPIVFEAFLPQSKRQEFAEFRADLKLLMSPVGGAVNRGNSQSAYNITCERHLTEDRNDWATGAFLYQLIVSDLGKGPSPALSLIRDILQNSKDEVSTLTSPIIAEAQPISVNIGSYPAENVFAKRGKFFQSKTLCNLRTGFDNLAWFENTIGGELDALRRFVAFGVFSVLLHMQNRCSEMEGKSSLTPTLLYFHDRYRSTAYQASHATYNLNRRAIETLYTSQLKEWLEPRLGPKPTSKRCESFINEIEFGRHEEKNRPLLQKAYQTFASQLPNLEAMAEGLRETVFRDLSGTPLDFYRGLGVRIGLVRPAGNNAVRKYYCLEGVLLEAVLASILPRGEMTYQQFLGQLFQQYGLLTGGRPEDSSVLMESGIGTATVEDLRANSQIFRQQLLSLGWARQYADGVMIVQVPEGLR